MRDLKAAGGNDHEALSSGKWEWLDPWNTNHASGYRGLAIQSTYHYRNVPLAIATACGYWPPSEAIAPVDQVYMGYTKPQVVAEAGCPPFKTQKLLGGRALVSDTFSWHNKGSGSSLPDEPGLGYYAHREGYNVLYGDWSAKWYGDPDQRIMWPTQVPYAGARSSYACGANNYIWTWYSVEDGSWGIPWWRHQYCSLIQWNRFDMSAGIDLHTTSPGTTTHDDCDFTGDPKP